MDFKYINHKSAFGMGNEILKNLLRYRGIKDVDLFLNLNESVIEDYKNYDNIEFVSNLYIENIKKEKSIGILVDFDSDGFTSASEIYMYTKDVCKLLNKPFKCEYIIHEYKSHGLDDKIAFNKLLNYDFVIIPDAGSNDFKELLTLKNKNIDFIILDHHQGDKKKLKSLNVYDTIINNQLSEKVTNKSMTGVGVVYKFMKCIDDMLGVNYADKYLDLVSFGLVADNADLRDFESRYLVIKGMNVIKKNNGSCKLLNLIYKSKSYSMKNEMTINGMAYYMIPSINCIIRGGSVEDREVLFKGFIGEENIYVDTIRGKGEVEFSTNEYIIRLYDKLKRKQDKIVEDSVKLLSDQIENYNLNNLEILIVNGNEIKDSTYNRVIVNNISSKYKKHVILLKHYYEDVYGGSATGFKNKDIKDLRQWCENSNLFAKSAGHPMAFGVNIKFNNIKRLYDLVNKLPTSNILTYDVDWEYNCDTISDSIITMIGSFKNIWGNKLDEPMFAIKDIPISSENISICGKNKSTLKLMYKGISFIKYKSSEEEYKEIIKNKANKFNFIGKFNINEYKNYNYPQVILDNYKYEEYNDYKENVFFSIQ